MSELFNTPLRSAALGVLIVAEIALFRGIVQGRSYRVSVLVLTSLALAMILISEGLQ